MYIYTSGSFFDSYSGVAFLIASGFPQLSATAEDGEPQTRLGSLLACDKYAGFYSVYNSSVAQTLDMRHEGEPLGILL